MVEKPTIHHPRDTGHLREEIHLADFWICGIDDSQFSAVDFLKPVPAPAVIFFRCLMQLLHSYHRETP